ncbi:TLDc domain-containing protein [Entamoeba marina]
MSANINPSKSIDNEWNSINSYNLLKQWVNKSIVNIIFDSDIDGNGSNKVLFNKVFGKSNLYFITFDENNNVFGGYIEKEINECDIYYIFDENSFIFSLIKNGKLKNKQYFMKQDKYEAFLICENEMDGLLYIFGNEVFNEYPVGSTSSHFYFNTSFYDFKEELNPITDIIYPYCFKVTRIMVIQMD